MHKIGVLNNRNIFYKRYEFQTAWADTLPNQNWLAVIIVSGSSKINLFDISEQIIDKDVCCVCCAGEQGELLHDIVDEDIIVRVLELDNKTARKTDIMTTWHDDIPDALWFAIYTADDELINLDTVVCLDARETANEAEIKQLVDWFGDGYIPPD